MTKSTTDMPTTFHPFPHLPPELRYQIWRESLPDKRAPALCPYKEGCWRRRYLTPSDKRYLHSDEQDANLNLDFRPDLELHVEVQIPLVFVSREARSVALGWASEQDITMRFDEERSCHIFTRPFALAYDILYLPQQSIPDFIDEPWALLGPEESGWFDLGLIRLAVSMNTLVNSRDLFGLYEVFRSPDELLVIVSPNLELGNESGMLQGRWELVGSLGRCIPSTHDDDSQGIEDTRWLDKTTMEKLEEARATFRQPFLDENEGVWKIRPIRVVRV